MVSAEMKYGTAVASGRFATTSDAPVPESASMILSSVKKNDGGEVSRLKSPVSSGSSTSLFPAQNRMVVGDSETARSTWLWDALPEGTPRTMLVKKSTAVIGVEVGRLFSTSARNTPGTARLVGLTLGSTRGATALLMRNGGAILGAMVRGDMLVISRTFGTPGSLTSGSTS